MQNQTVHFVLRKLLIAALTVLLVTLLSFLLMRLSPVDPATAYVKADEAGPNPTAATRTPTALDPAVRGGPKV